MQAIIISLRSLLSFLLVLGMAMLMTGCGGFFGNKTDTEFLEPPVYIDRQVAYVPLQPAITGLSQPVDVIAGWDELIYVVDAGTEEIIAYDQALNELSRFRVQGLVGMAQTRTLDILAIGRMDTVISGSPLNLPALYRISLKGSGGYGLQNARVIRKITHPFYFKSGTPTGADEAVDFTGIAPLANNQYYLSRTGPSNAVSQFGGPDNAVLLFSEEDVFISPIAVNSNLGLFRDYFKQPSDVVTYAQPPQSSAVSNFGHFIYSSLDPDNALKVQIIVRIETPFGAEYQLSILPAGDTSKADGFLYTPDRFGQPTGLTIAGDETAYLFVVDAEKDSLYQFNQLGHEGVNPPAGSNSTKSILVSFGGTGDGLGQFRDPMGVAYLDKIIYVADMGNGRITRFKLTTDFD